MSKKDNISPELEKWMNKFGGANQTGQDGSQKNEDDKFSTRADEEWTDPNSKWKKRGRFSIKAIVLFIVAIILVSIALDSFYTVKETQTAVITTFGKAQINPGKGLQFKIPFVQKLHLVNTTVQGFTIGYGVAEDGTTYDLDEESVMITADYNFLDVDFYVSYTVTDPVKYLYASDNPELILKNIAMTSIRSTMSAYSVDAALTTGKSEIQSNIKQMIINKLEVQDIGISLNDALIQDVEPPTDEVANAFKAVETAKQNKESAINEANQYRNEKLPAAEAKKDNILQTAEAKKTSRINEANGQVARFNEEYEQYKRYPLITKQRMFYETMEELLPNMKVIIDNGNGDIKKYYPVESFFAATDDNEDNINNNKDNKEEEDTENE